MRSAERGRVRFAAALVKAGSGTVRDGRAIVASGGAEVAIELASARELASQGLLVLKEGAILPTENARTWLRRQLLRNGEALAGQHQVEAVAPDGTRRNVGESPLSRLATATGGEAPFLSPHQFEAGERVRRLAERAQMQPRITMRYSAAHIAGSRGPQRAAEMSDMAAEARKALADIHRVLPRDCAGVVLDVCGFLKGLQVVEQERGWPRRSAKLVLRIGLEQLAQHYGLSAEAVGGVSNRPHSWLGEGARPDRFE